MNEHKDFDHAFIYKHFEHFTCKHFLVFFIFANKLSTVFLCFSPNLSRFFDSCSRFLVREFAFFLEDSSNLCATCIPSKSFLSRAALKLALIFSSTLCANFRSSSNLSFFFCMTALPPPGIL